MAKRTPKQRAVIEQYKRSMYHRFNFGKAKQNKTPKFLDSVMPPDFDGHFPERLTRETLKLEYSHEVYD
jgi:hypothetical protein